jgi:hypothetical protein
MKTEIGNREQVPLTERLLVLQEAERIINGLKSDIIVLPVDNNINLTKKGEDVVMSDLELTRRSVDNIYGQTN